jgi:hypothetical protein
VQVGEPQRLIRIERVPNHHVGPLDAGALQRLLEVVSARSTLAPGAYSGSHAREYLT